MTAVAARAAVAMLATLVAAGRPGVGHAQSLDALLGQPVIGVRVVADGQEVSDPAISALLDTRRGRPLDMSDVRRTLRALAALERFADIAVEAEARPGGVALTYVVAWARRVDGLDFRGELGLSRGRLARALEQRYGPTPGARRAREMAATLVGALRDEGFLDAQVSSRLESRPDGRTAQLVFDVTAGPRYLIGAVTVTGQTRATTATWLARLNLARGRPWREPDARARAERELRRLREAGRYEARLDIQPVPRADAPVVDVTVTIVEGPIVEIVFTGDPVTGAAIDDLVPVAREGSTDEDLLEDARRRVEQLLQGQGYWRASVRYARTLDGDRRRLTFDVQRGRAYVVDRVELAGVASVPREELDALLALRAGRPFVEARLDADASALTQAYLRRGFGQVTVTHQIRELPASGAEGRVVVTFTVEEGRRTLVRQVTFTGELGLDEGRLRGFLRSEPGAPFETAAAEGDRQALEMALVEAGFPDAVVALTVRGADEAGLVDLVYDVRSGPRVRVDHVILAGNERTSARTILRELQIAQGQPVGPSDLVEAQRRLVASGLFRRVRIEMLREPAGAPVDLVVVVEENAATTIGYGVGLEGGRRLRRADETGLATERFEVAPRGFVELGRRNLWGKNRSLNLFARASLRQQPGSVDNPAPGGFGIYDYRVVGAFREPRAFGTAAEAAISGVFEQAVRSSFSYRRRALTASISDRVSGRLAVLARYSYGYTDVYEERYSREDKPLIDRLFPQVTLSSFAGTAAWDTRDDVIDPTRGELVSVEAEVAARAIASEVGFVKTFSQGFLYRRVPGTRVVVAGGVRLGLAAGFPRQVERVDEFGNPVFDPDGNRLIDTVRDLPASERFYAGGDSTVRGFAQDRLGDVGTIDAAGFPTGGDAVLVGNLEVRVPITRSIGGVVFVDAGNVFARIAQIDLGRLRGAAGLGVRYRSPLGPLRLDVGFKFDPREIGVGQRERGYAIHVSIGQAF